jgi:hypothetical protein
MRKVLIGAVLVLVVVLAIAGISAGRNDTAIDKNVPGTNCPTGTENQLAAQTVPSASLVPCITLFGGRWTITGETYDDQLTRIAMVGEDAPEIRWTVELTAGCDPSGLTARAGVDGASVFEADDQGDSTFSQDRMLVFDGGCVTSSLDMPIRIDRALVLGELDATLMLVERAALDAQVRAQTGGDLGLDP